jgi:hypothetical protein
MTVSSGFEDGKPGQDQELTRPLRMQVPSGNRSRRGRGCGSGGSPGRTTRKRANGWKVEAGKCRCGNQRKRIEPGADRPRSCRPSAAQAAGRRKIGPAQSSVPRRRQRKRLQVEHGGSSGRPARLCEPLFRERSHEAGRQSRSRIASPEAERHRRGDRREARMPLPARVEHAAETRPRVRPDRWP